MRLAAIASAMLMTLVLAACGGGGSTTPPAASPPAASEPAASEPGSPAAADACAPSTDAATVTVAMADFEFAPAEATAAVGDVVAWSNSDAAPHTATLDDGACATGNIPTGGSGALVFNTAGTFPYHCAIHPQMTGTVTITE
jgi:plastocyanin